MSQLTIEFYVRYEGQAGAMHVVRRQRASGSPEDQYRVVIRGCALEFAIDGFVPEGMRGETPCLLSVGWNYVVATSDGARMRLYVNGVLQRQSAEAPPPIPAGTGGVVFGENIDHLDRLVGELQYVRISRVARSAFGPNP